VKGAILPRKFMKGPARFSERFQEKKQKVASDVWIIITATV
jgi:hypothetical protein